MRRNCNLELRLLPPSASFHSTGSGDHHHQSMVGMANASPKEEQLQQFTVFYNGRVSVCDVTELQAKAIIMIASGEMEEKLRSPYGSEPSTPLVQTQVYSPTGLSMKRSLQRFLQKRKNRIQAISPYSH